VVPRALPRRAAVGIPESWRPSSGQVLLVGLVALYFLALASLDWYWPRFGVPAGTGFSFLDFRYWTTAWECVRAGTDVVPVNPCDPRMREFDHPRLWLAPAFLGLGESSTSALGGLIAGSFFASVLALIGRITPADAVLYAALICSPAVMLGVERGNTDLIVFVLVFWGVVVARRSARVAAVLGHGLLLLAAMLKLYPVLAWAGLLRRPFRHALPGLIALFVAFAAYVVATREHLETLREIFPRQIQHSYGAPILADSLGLDGLRGHVLVVAFGCAIAGLVVALTLRRGRRRANDVVVPRELALFWAGAGVFVGSYALTHNFNYRLAFLLLAVPQLLRWAVEPSPRVSYPRAALTLVLLTMWLGTSISFYPFGLGEWWEDFSAGFQYDELVNLLLFGYLVAAGVLTLASRAATTGNASAKATKT
jgi:hypothetical protein